MVNPQDIFKNFQFEGTFEFFKSYGTGHINDTFALYVKDASVRRYLLQRINGTLFSDVPSLMQNIRYVTDHIRQKVVARGQDPNRGTLTIVPTTEGKDYYFDGRNYWRAYLFIEDATAYDVPNYTAMYAGGIGFGQFAQDLADFDANLLSDVLPDFHDTRKRFNDFCRAVESDPLQRASDARAEIEFLMSFKEYASLLPDLVDQKVLPLRVTLNDTKLDNILIDNKTNRATAVIDLDTVMKGSLCTDFGDAVRFGCNSAKEDEQDLDIVTFNTDLFTAFCRGYFETAHKMLTQAEVIHLFDGAVSMMYEQALRFLEDYLTGDHYYHTSRIAQNKDRAQVQIKLMSEMLKKQHVLQEIVQVEYRSFSEDVK